MKHIEAVPNFSEGRDKETIRQIADALSLNHDVRLLDIHSDPDHNRSVYTLIGEANAISDALYCGIETSSRLIDMERHTGQHPCIGAADVIPFIPFEAEDMPLCVQLARSLGEKIARELNLPVYLYGEAAINACHENLADLRRGGYFGLKEKIATDADLFPDYGPRFLASAGACAIGARDFLIAFNIFLDTCDTQIAKRIAKKIRTSNGGLPFLKAIGVLANGKAQVSMNLTNYRVTPPKTVFNAVNSLCQEYHTRPLYSELVGLIPRDALKGCQPEEILLFSFDQSKIIENRL